MLDSSRHGDAMIVVAPVYAVCDRAVVKQGHEYFFYRSEHAFQATDVEIGLLLAGKRGLGKVLGGGGGAHRDRDLRIERALHFSVSYRNGRAHGRCQ